MDNLWHPGIVRLDVGDFGQWNFKFKQLRRQKKIGYMSRKTTTHFLDVHYTTICYAKSDKISKMQLCNSNPQIHFQDR